MDKAHIVHTSDPKDNGTIGVGTVDIHEWWILFIVEARTKMHSMDKD